MILKSSRPIAPSLMLPVISMIIIMMTMMIAAAAAFSMKKCHDLPGVGGTPMSNGVGLFSGAILRPCTFPVG